LKKRSGQKASSPPPSPEVIFVDRSLGSQKVPAGLRASGIHVEVHDDHFARDEDDIVWLKACGKNGWVVLTKDERIRRDPAEVRAIIASGAHAIFIGRQDVTAEEMLQDLLPALPRMMKRFAGAQPTYLLVHKGGRVDRLVVEITADRVPRLTIPKPKARRL
jgi:predicted nuclease of predicted toxin-antitoxin system